MVNNKKKKRREFDWILLGRRCCLVLLDLCVVTLSMCMALWIRFDFQFLKVDPVFWDSIVAYWPFNLFSTLLLFGACLLYRSLWRFASVEEVKYVIVASVSSGIVQVVGMRLFGLSVPRSYPFLYTFLLMFFTMISRFSYRGLRLYLHGKRPETNGANRRTMVVGAGSAGFLLVREIRNSKHLNRTVCCIVDDDTKKIGTYMQGTPVVGDHSRIPEFVEQYRIQDIIIAIPNLGKETRQQMLKLCQTTDCHVMILPSLPQMVEQEVTFSSLREIEIEDLLGREPVRMDQGDVCRYVRDKVILVTGGGGSIGSELCRQIATYAPKQLIIFDIYENNAYDIQLELRRNHPELDLKVLIGSVRNSRRVNSVFETYHPNIVFHAAAHKHVPLMEDSPNEAIKNNILGTWNVARAADRYGADKMVLISTDKAVRPTNIMGASKRICELVINLCSRTAVSDIEYAAVRFGNVLGSNGSVIPLFRKQIATGGPVTVTDKRIIRYFMTIPEAVNLVLQCGALANGNEIFILDMGEPVKIDDLARNMIRLSGLVPDQDIKIVYTGLRPGEKLYEELLIDENNLVKTEKERIFVCEQPDNIDLEELTAGLNELIERAWEEDSDIRSLVKKLVPEYVINNN